MDPIIVNTRFFKVLMDGGSSLNILYAHTLELMGIGLDKLHPSMSPFHGVAPGKRVQPLGQIDLPVCFGTAANFRKEVLTIEVVGFRGSYHAILGAEASTGQQGPPQAHAPMGRTYIIAEVLKPGTYKLANENGEVLANAWNIQQLRHFYP